MAVNNSDEQPFSPGPRSLSFYAVLLFLVAPIWSIVPLSWAYTIYTLIFVDILALSVKRKALLVFTICEVLFSICHFYLAHRISPPAPNPPSDVAEFQLALERSLKSGLANLPSDGGDEENVSFLNPGSPAESIERLSFNDPRAVDFRSCFRTWFFKAPLSQIRYEHVQKWLYFLAFNSLLPDSGEVPKSNRAIVDEATSLVEKRVGMMFSKATPEELTKTKIIPMLLTFDPLNVLSRPFLWYIFVKLCNLLVMKWFEVFHGLKYGRFRSFEYLLYIPPNYSRETGPDPVIFLHGLGLGVVQHLLVLLQFFQQAPDTPLLIPIQPQVSQDIFHVRFLHPMNRREKVTRLKELLVHLDWVGIDEKSARGVTILSHSNGTYVHAWMLKTYPEFVTRSCFMDPVTFCSWEGDVCYNFVYRKCTTGIELIIRYFAGSELGVSNVIQRHFDWLSSSLWFNEIPSARDPQRSVFLLSGKDTILDAERVKKYLTSHGIKKGIWYYPNSFHGEAIIRPSRGMRRFFEWLKDAPPKQDSLTSSQIINAMAHDRTNDNPFDQDSPTQAN